MNKSDSIYIFSDISNRRKLFVLVTDVYCTPDTRAALMEGTRNVSGNFTRDAFHRWELMHSDGAAARGVGRVVSARGVTDTSGGVSDRHAVTVLLWQVRRLVSPHRRADLSRREGL